MLMKLVFDALAHATLPQGATVKGAVDRFCGAFSGSVCVTQVSPVMLPVAPFVNMVCDPHIDRRAAKPPTRVGQYIIHINT